MLSRCLNKTILIPESKIHKNANKIIILRQIFNKMYLKVIGTEFKHTLDINSFFRAVTDFVFLNSSAWIYFVKLTTDDEENTLLKLSKRIVHYFYFIHLLI